jgi:hypothetical protein
MLLAVEDQLESWAPSDAPLNASMRWLSVGRKGGARYQSLARALNRGGPIAPLGPQVTVQLSMDGQRTAVLGSRP